MATPPEQPEPPPEPSTQSESAAPSTGGFSLDRLTKAFARTVTPRDAGQDSGAVSPDDEPAATGEPLPKEGLPEEGVPKEGSDAVDDAGEISPRSIVEAALFVGLPGSEPLTSRQLAGLMRDVTTLEIDALVAELNHRYKERGCPYTVESVGAGYRMALRPDYAAIRERFHGKARQSRLSQAALEVLAAVAYHEPLTGKEADRLRGRSSGALLAQMVRRELLRLEITDTKTRERRYYTTPRFLKLFGLESLADLPRSGELDHG